jgi:hypothetical protein
MKHIKHINEFFYFHGDTEHQNDELMDKEISLVEKLINVHSNREPEIIEGTIIKIEGAENIPILVIADKNDKLIANVMYDKDPDEFVAAHSSYHITYEGNNEESTKLLDIFKEMSLDLKNK